MIQILFYITVILSLLSQLPVILDSHIDVYFKLTWIPLTIVLFIQRPSFIIDKRLFFFWVFFLVFFIYCAIIQYTTDKEYIGAGADIYNISISFMIFADSVIFWDIYGSRKTYKLLSATMLIVGVVLAYCVFIQYLQTADIASMSYAYKEKNSLGQILFAIGVVSIFSYKLFKSKSIKTLIIISLFVLLIVIMLLKSRATIMCLVILLAYYILKRRTVFKQIYLSVILFCAIMVIFLDDNLYTLIVENILFANRNSSSVDSLSSGRYKLILRSLSLIDANFFFGVGNKYLDCMPIAIWMQYGIIGFTIVFSFLVILGKKVLTLSATSIINTTSSILFYAYMANSLFEAYPPFGPGIKCFILWMVLGFSFSNKKSFCIDGRKYPLIKRNMFTTKIN